LAVDLRGFGETGPCGGPS